MKCYHLLLTALSLSLVGLITSSQATNPANSSRAEAQQNPSSDVPLNQSPSGIPSSNLTQLFSRIWRVTSASTTPAPGSIHVFLPNGTLLSTSCVETYGIYTWRIYKNAPRVLRVTENGQLAYTATILKLTDTKLRLRKNLVLSNEIEEVTLTAVQKEFVCPDLRK
jgi:hypothetical protein